MSGDNESADAIDQRRASVNREKCSPVSFGDRLRLLASERADATAVHFRGARLSYRELDERSDRVAGNLVAFGIGVDELVTFSLRNSLEFFTILFGIWKAGGVPQPVSYRLSANELCDIIALSCSKVVVSDHEIRGIKTIEPRALEAVPNISSMLPDHIPASMKAPTSGGSTGRPKLIVDGHPALYEPHVTSFWKICANDRAIICAPLYHNGPLSAAIAAVLEGASVYLHERFDAVAVLRSIAEHHITWAYFVPTMMSRIWKLESSIKASCDVSSLKTIWHTAAPCPPWLKQAWINWFGPEVIWEVCGSTEGIAMTVIGGAEWLERPGSVGRAYGGARIRILDESRNELPAGEVGEVFLRRADGVPVTYHYIGAEAITCGDWETLGDVGYLDQDGYLYLTDRKKDMILVGGVNIYPAEVEGAIESYPNVLSCAVIGLPEEDLGNTIHAIIQPGPAFEEDEFRRHLAEVLAKPKHPHSIELVDYPVRDDAGKVRRSQLANVRALKR